MMMAKGIILATSSSPNLSVAAEKEKLGKAALDVKENFAAGFQCEETEFDVTSAFRGGKGDENLEVGICLRNLKLPYPFSDVHWRWFSSSREYEKRNVWMPLSFDKN
jgi:hypothetical protein